MKTQVLGFDIDTYTFSETLEVIDGFLKEDKLHVIFTPNPENIMLARKDAEFREALKIADLSIPDGIGVVLASKLNSVKIKERVTGYDLAVAMLDRYKDSNSFYFFGAMPGVASKAKACMENQHKGLRVIGVSDGYFDEEKERAIVEQINQKKPDILFVGLNMGMMEKWVCKHRHELDVKVVLCFGGALDHFAGNKKRAPLFMRKLGLEWFYRLFTLKRLKRQKELWRFVAAVIKDKFRKKTAVKGEG